MIGYFEYQSLQNKKMHLQNLVALAEADGKLHADEIDLLNKIGKHYGLKKNQILEIFREQKNAEQKIPVNFDQKINQLFEMVKLMMVDNIVDEKEMEIATEMAENLNFKKGVIQKLIELNQKKSLSMWEWEEFKTRALDDYLG
ncbi:hypothetical protein HZR84_10180 [Hyphobacterium sp. CCMP332]|nr:hypothetical protein HZR84_10180 [Hyphobacterium sp. CCMP332]